VQVPGGSYALADTDLTPDVTQSFTYTPLAGQGSYAFYTRAFDTAGNVELPPAGPNAQVSVLYDTTAPATSDDAPAAWQNGAVTVTLSPTDPGVDPSGVDKTFYKVDAAVSFTEDASVSIPAPADHSNDGAHTISYYSTDKAGNQESNETATVRIDTLRPSSSILCNGAVCAAMYYNADVTVKLNGGDGGGSNLKGIRYTTDGSDAGCFPRYGDRFRRHVRGLDHDDCQVRRDRQRRQRRVAGEQQGDQHRQGQPELVDPVQRRGMRGHVIQRGRDGDAERD
jgi:hypothetical protein